jgi:hypothetical protein
MAHRCIRCAAKYLVAIGCTGDFAVELTYIYEFAYEFTP